MVPPTLPAPWLLKAKLAATPIFVPTPAPFVHTAGSSSGEMGYDGMWQPGCQGSPLALHLPLPWPQDNLREIGSDSHQHPGVALGRRRAPQRAGANRTLPLSLRMPSMLCLAFLSPSSTSFLSSSASSSSPFPNLLRRMRLMELTSGGECRAVTGSSPAAPRGSRAGPGSRVPHQCHWPVSLGHCRSGLGEGSCPFPSPRDFHGAQARTGLQHGHSSSRESFFPESFFAPSPHGGL